MMKSMLYLMLKSPSVCNAVETIELLSKNGNKAILLSEDGIYHAVQPSQRQALLDHGIKIYAIEDNLAARGFDGFEADGVEVIDCSRAVDMIMEEYETTLTI